MKCEFKIVQIPRKENTKKKETRRGRYAIYNDRFGLLSCINRCYFILHLIGEYKDVVNKAIVIFTFFFHERMSFVKYLSFVMTRIFSQQKI